MAWYLVVGLACMIVGLIIGVLIDRDTVNKYYNKFRKIKVKDSQDISDLIDIDQAKEDLKAARKARRKARRKAKRSPVTNDL